jgi:hypothetical protein
MLRLGNPARLTLCNESTRESRKIKNRPHFDGIPAKWMGYHPVRGTPTSPLVGSIGAEPLARRWQRRLYGCSQCGARGCELGREADSNSSEHFAFKATARLGVEGTSGACQVWQIGTREV